MSVSPKLSKGLKLYHRTTAAGAQAILADGFRDGTGTYLTDREWSGVWLSNNPLDENEGTKGPVLLEVSVKATHREMAQFEWIEEGKPYREWLIPATFLNSRMVVKVAGGGMSVSPKLSKGQLQALHSLFHLYAPRFLDTTDSGAGSDAARGARLTWASGIIGHELSSFNDLQPDEAAQLIETMKKALGQEIKPARRARERRPGRDLARAYGTAGRRGESSNEIQMVDGPTSELLDRLREQLGWTRERLDAFLKSKHSPIRSGVVRTLGEANRVIWAMRQMLRRAA